MVARQPHHVYQGLTAARLRRLAQIIRAARKQAIESAYDPALDLPWGIGCLAYGRIVRAIMAAADPAVDGGWLGIIEPPLHFVFSIAGFPVRFYRGAGDGKPREGQTRRGEPEIRAVQLALGLDGGQPTELLYRIVYETDPATLLASRVFFVEMDQSGDIVDVWDVDELADGSAEQTSAPRSPATQPSGAPVIPISAGDPVVRVPPAKVELVKEILEAEEMELREEREGRP